MPPVGSTRPPTASVNTEFKLFYIRILQTLLLFPYLAFIALTTIDIGRWTYPSIRVPIALGSTAAALTLIIALAAIFHLDSHATTPLIHFIVRFSTHLSVAILWSLAFLTSLLPKQVDPRNAGATAPYKSWVAGVIVTAVESTSFLVSALIILAAYRTATPRTRTRIGLRGPGDIELQPPVGASGTASRPTGGWPSEGLGT
ncbi:MAG: hypothetical protein Q9181_003865, partial [Wetmoreana brouardii]